MKNHSFKHQAQTAVEYLLMLAAVVVVMLLALKTILPRTQLQSEDFFNQASQRIMGNVAVNKARKSSVNYP